MSWSIIMEIYTVLAIVIYNIFTQRELNRFHSQIHIINTTFSLTQCIQKVKTDY